MSCNKMGALAFAPLDTIQNTYNRLIDEFTELDEEESLALLDIAGYFKINFLGSNGIRPRFEPNLWNQRENCLNREPRTNNRIEGWHRHFIGLASTCHPLIRDFINIVKRDLTFSFNKITQIEVGNNAPQSKKTINLAERIKNVILNNDDPMHVIANIALFYQFPEEI